MKKIIAFTVISFLCTSMLLGNNKPINLRASTFVDSLPKNIDSAYAQKKIAYHQDTVITPHFDTLNANPVFKQIDSANAAKIKTDSTVVKKKAVHSSKKKNKSL